MANIQGLSATLSEFITKFNTFISSVKKIDDLPQSATVVDSAKLHISDNGNSKSLLISKLLDSVKIKEVTTYQQIIDGSVGSYYLTQVDTTHAVGYYIKLASGTIIDYTKLSSFINDGDTLGAGDSFALRSELVPPTGLEKITENGQTGFRLIGMNPVRFGNIGAGAVDLSASSGSNAGTNGATGSRSFAANVDNRATNARSTCFGINNISSGQQSFGTGTGCTASGLNAFTQGYSVLATGSSASAFGANTKSQGAQSVAFGSATTANGAQAFVAGSTNYAAGNISTCFGSRNYARSFNETVFGYFATDYTGYSKTLWNLGDRLFNIGYGTHTNNRKDAFTILKNGNIGIGKSNFEANDSGEKLQVNGKIKAVDINFSGLPVFVDEISAAALATGDCYQTPTGELRIKL